MSALPLFSPACEHDTPLLLLSLFGFNQVPDEHPLLFFFSSFSHILFFKQRLPPFFLKAEGKGFPVSAEDAHFNHSIAGFPFLGNPTFSGSNAPIQHVSVHGTTLRLLFSAAIPFAHCLSLSFDYLATTESLLRYRLARPGSKSRPRLFFSFFSLTDDVFLSPFQDVGVRLHDLPSSFSPLAG